ncbi:ABC transporter substrate-binding protein [Trebonia sp.]|uniref:ABC transporter substrate-binding protein n=1 Tax=Trebonia sp. TaxID=2767075 RepID=UPI00262318B1|nr:ABC transporter substrate-binding protein [Trebonia sp.]
MTDQTAQPASPAPGTPAGGVSRRGLFRAAGVGAAVVGGGSLLEACSSSIKGASSTKTTTKEITIGWIHPLTGSLAGFGYPDHWVIEQVTATSQYKNGFKIGGSTYKVNILSYDTQSSVTRAGTLAKQAIQVDNVDLLFASSTPETVNAVSSEAETLGTPLVCANIPWESWYINLGGNPAKPTLKPKYVVMYFLGAEHLAKCFIPMWNRIGAKYGNDHIVAAAFPNDSDGNAFRAVFPPILKAAGYTIDMSVAYPDGLTNYTSMITQFKNAKADFFTNVPLPPDFATMWKQSLQQDFRPKLATVAKVLLFPTDAYAMGSEVYNVATDSWWVPSLPWTSSFTGQTCEQLAALFTADGLGQPNANISNYTLFEIAYAAMQLVNDPHNHDEVAAAIHNVVIPVAVAGPMDFTSPSNPAPGVVITPPVGIQWQKGTTYPLEAVVVDNTLQPLAKITGNLYPTFA